MLGPCRCWVPVDAGSLSMLGPCRCWVPVDAGPLSMLGPYRWAPRQLFSDDELNPNTNQQSLIVKVMGPWECYWSMARRPADSSKVMCTPGSVLWGTCGADLGGPLVVPNFNATGNHLLEGTFERQSKYNNINNVCLSISPLVALFARSKVFTIQFLVSNRRRPKTPEKPVKISIICRL
uniref:SFRICE_029890 n=1 Tax=Spodoptera frugiperda TaxID=7108 RepID=A0A2H1WA96_SPOFR